MQGIVCNYPEELVSEPRKHVFFTFASIWKKSCHEHLCIHKKTP